MFELDVWTGDPDAPDVEGRESYRSAQLEIIGLLLFHVDAPDGRYPFSEAKPLRVDLCAPEPTAQLELPLSPNVFQSRLYVSNWNSFIHLAAEEAAFRWSDGAPGAG